MLDKKLLGPIGLLAGIGTVVPAIGTAEASLICGATQCTESQGFSLTSTPATQGEPVFSSSGTVSASDPKTTTVTFDQFDPLLGTLTEVDISLSSTLTGSLTVIGSESSTNSATGTWAAGVTLTMPGGFSFTDSQTVPLSCGPFFCTMTNSAISFAEDASPQAVAGSLAGYIGNGTFTGDLGLNLTISANNNGAGAAQAYGSATWDPPVKGVTVTYIFTPAVVPTAPEPSTLALLGMSAAAGWGFARRRSKEDR